MEHVAKFLLSGLMFFAVALSCNGQQPNAQELLQQADAYSQKTYFHNKALKAYLHCFRLYGNGNKKGQQDVIRKVTSLVCNRRSLVNIDVHLVDSLINEARPSYGKSAQVFLPLIEQRVINSFNLQGSYKEEFVLIDEALALRHQNNLLKGPDYEQLLRKYSSILFKKTISEKDKQAIYAELWKVYQENNAGKDSLDIKLVDDYARACKFANDEEQETKLYEVKREYLEKTNQKDSKVYLDNLWALQYAYDRLHVARHGRDNFSMTEEIRKKEDYLTLMLEIQRKNGIDWKKSDILGLVTTMCIHKGDTIAVRTFAEDYCGMMEQKHGKESEAYCNALEIVVQTYQDDIPEVIPIMEELLALKEKVYGTESIEYEGTKSRLSLVYSRTHRKGESIELMKKGKDDDVEGLQHLADELNDYGRFREATEVYGRMMEIMANNQQEKDRYFHYYALRAINCYHKLNDVDGLLAFGKKWTIDKRLTPMEQKLVFKNVVGTASYPQRSSERLLAFIDDYMLSHPSIMATTESRAEILEQKAVALAGMNRYEDSENVFRSLVKTLQREKADIRTIIWYELMTELSVVLQERVGDALALNLAIQQHISQLTGYETMVEYFGLLCRQAIYEDANNHFDEVLRIYSKIEAFDMQKVTELKPSDVFNVNFLSFLISSPSEPSRCLYRALCHKGLVSDAEKEISKRLPSSIALAKSKLSELDGSQLQNRNSWMSGLNNDLTNIALLSGSDSLAIKSYDYALLYKQSFLAAEHMMRQQLLGSGNVATKEKFKELQNLRTFIVQQEAAGLPVSELKERSRQLEIQIVEDSKIYGDFTRGINLTWRDVRGRLGKEDLAIEFLSYIDYADRTEHLAALLLRPDWNAPRILHLFSSSQIPKDVYHDVQFAKLLWTPLLQHLEGVKNVFFAPAGELYNICIESMLSPDGETFFGQTYNLYRISSTRELVGHSSEAGKQESRTVVYGGIEYDADANTLKTDANRYSSVSTNSDGDRGLWRDIRGAMESIPYLPATKKEAEDVSSILSNEAKYGKAILLTGTEATETSFKALGGQPFAIAHISTHGFYHKGHAISPSSTYLVLQEESEDKALTRSGLLFAGASNTIQSDEVPDGADDGILTAQEISTLDLSSLNMVVLSACQTGQGDITGDGVFGLQRGFKKAGVQSILMSLWKVDDEATCLLMTEFYRHWIGEKKTKHYALELAKQTVRSHKDMGWDDPKYWAAFILLDGLD